MFTDRGVYRLNDEVHFKAIVREDAESGARLLRPGSVLDVVIENARGDEIDRRTMRTGAWSSSEWTWRVPPDGALGHYRIALSRPGAEFPEITESFLVAAFRKPDFRVDTTLTAGEPILGAPLHAGVVAKYLSGSALAARPVTHRAWSAATFGPPAAILDRYPEARYAVGYRPDDSEVSVSGSATLDGDGRLVTDVPTVAADAAREFTFEADVESLAGQHIANRSTLVMHPASFYLAISRPPMFLDTNRSAAIAISAVSLSGAPMAGVPVAVSLVRQQWSQLPPRAPGGDPQWGRQEIPAREWSIDTTAAGAPLELAVREAGSYILRAKAQDAAGRSTRTELYFYAVGPGVWLWRDTGNTIPLTPERETWKPGETARVLVQSPWPQATGLLTVEREGVRSHRHFSLTSMQHVVDVPIGAADVPGVFVSVTLVKGRTALDFDAQGKDAGQPAFRVGYTRLTVADDSKRLRVGIATDRESYRPGQPATVSVDVRGADGAPAPSEVTIWAVDYGLLTLTNYETPDLLASIYAPRPLGVLTADNRSRLMSRLPRPPAEPLDLVNTSRASVGELEVQVDGSDNDLRADFRPLVFWAGSAVTGADGRVSTTVTLPDGLTTYRIMAVAADKASRAGSGARDVRVSKPLTLLPSFPRFLKTGDRAALTTVVTNTTGADGTATVTLEPLGAGALRSIGDTRRTVRLARNESASLGFDVEAIGSGPARVRLRAVLGLHRDAVQTTLRVAAPVRTMTAAAYGEVTGTASERIVLPASAVGNRGGLSVHLAGSVLVGLGESVRYLDEYPYSCAEQKASRALALLLASDMDGVALLPGRRKQDYRAAAVSALKSLDAHRCFNGGFALWPGRCESTPAYLTAYVLHVMRAFQRAGIEPDAEVVANGLRDLDDQMDAPAPAGYLWTAWAVSQAYAAKVRAEYRSTVRRGGDRAGVADRSAAGPGALVSGRRRCRLHRSRSARRRPHAQDWQRASGRGGSCSRRGAGRIRAGVDLELEHARDGRGARRRGQAQGDDAVRGAAGPMAAGRARQRPVGHDARQRRRARGAVELFSRGGGRGSERARVGARGIDAARSCCVQGAIRGSARSPNANAGAAPGAGRVIHSGGHTLASRRGNDLLHDAAAVPGARAGRRRRSRLPHRAPIRACTRRASGANRRQATVSATSSGSDSP